MMLMVFSGAGAPAGTQHVDGRIVEGFLTEYLEECEGSLRLDDTDAQALLTACRRPGGLPWYGSANCRLSFRRENSKGRLAQAAGQPLR